MEAQLNALNTSEQEADEVRAVCRMAAEGLDHFNSARKKATIELFDVRVTGLWGEIKEEDRLRITGRIPATDLQVTQAVYSLATAPHISTNDHSAPNNNAHWKAPFVASPAALSPRISINCLITIDKAGRVCYHFKAWAGILGPTADV